MCQICAAFNPFLNNCEYETLPGAPGDGGETGTGTPGPQGIVVNESGDAAGNTGTTASMGVGDYFHGELATGGDRDWVEVTLEAGKTYTFGLVGTGALDDAANDTYLRLHNSAGTQIDESDDDGPGRNSTITFTATSTGTYYLDVGSYAGIDEGTYGLSMVEGDRASYDIEMAAGNLLRPSSAWTSTAGTGATVTWSIRASGDDGNGFVAPSSAQVAAIEETMAYISGVTGLNLNQVNPGGTSNSATMVFGAYSANDGAGAYAYYPGSTSSSSDAGDVWLNNNSVSQSSLPVGSYSYFVMLHEIGHAIGLAHPGDYNAGVGVSITYANNAQFIEDSHQYSVMSYFDESNTTGSFGSYPDTLLLHDLYALHQLYGADNSFHSGNTTYGFNATSGIGDAYNFNTNTNPFLSIWDGSGTDTIDLSGYSMAQTVSLEEGSFSNVGGYSGNLSIAIGAVIENAIGGSGNDNMTGNGVGNLLEGGVGNDYIEGAGGADDLKGNENNDTLYGGTGNDTIRGNKGDDTLYGEDGNDLISGGNGNDEGYGGDGDDDLRGKEGNDTLYGGDDDDTVRGNKGNDTLYGEAGDDFLTGGGDEDSLSGGSGFDTLVGGDGDDTLTGNFNADTFVFANGFGQDVITDFEATNDFEKIDLSAVSSITSYADLTNAGSQHMTQVGANVVINDFSGNTITLLGVNLGDLDALDFIF